MLSHLQATGLILAWCALASVVTALVTYELAARRARTAQASGPRDARALAGAALLPALVLAPLAVALAFDAFRVNLIYPVQLLATPLELAGAAIVPALVLVLASGLAQGLRRGVRDGYVRWRARPFAEVARAYGSEPRRVLRRVVLLEALATAWGTALPWIFSELIVVEAVFNAPGLGLAAWQAARERDFAALGATLAVLAAAYAALAAASAFMNRRLGRRLESYA